MFTDRGVREMSENIKIGKQKGENKMKDNEIKGGK